MSIPDPCVLPLQAALIRAAEEIERRLRDGETIPYGAFDAMDDLRWHDLRRRIRIEEVPGEGWRMVQAPGR